MDSQESSFQILPKMKLPLTADWWRDVDKNKEKSTFSEMESLEVLTPDLISVEQKETTVQRESTIASSGMIEISNILFPTEPETEREAYEKNCERLHCASSRKFGKTLDEISMGSNNDDVNMAHYGLTSVGIRATAISISNLSQCSAIDLEGNKLTPSSLNALISVLKKSTVTEINLSSTNISKFGPKIFAQWLSSPMRVKKFYIRDNQFEDTDGVLLFEALASNRSITVLDLSHNHLCIRCGDALKKLLDENDILEELDLSWNHLRLNAIFSIAKGLKKNNGIKVLKLNWNGVEDTGMKEIGLSLKDNDCLQQLELFYNRITDSGFQMFMKCLEKNLSLKCIKIGGNIISQQIAEKILESFKGNELRDCSIDTLDFTNSIFRSTFQTAINNVKEIRGGFNCYFGYGDKYGKRKIVSDTLGKDALLFLKTYVEKNNIDLYKLFALKGEMNVTYDEFRRVLKEVNVPMTDEQVHNIIKYLESDKNGSIDLSELMMEKEEQKKLK